MPTGTATFLSTDVERSTTAGDSFAAAFSHTSGALDAALAAQASLVVIAYFSVNAPDAAIHRYLRPVATSGLFDT